MSETTTHGGRKAGTLALEKRTGSADDLQEKPDKMEVFCDSNFGRSPEQSQSRTGHICVVGGSVASSSARLSRLTAQTTTEAELIVIIAAAREGC